VAKDKKQAKKFGGPFLAAAVFCESILEDAGGKMSAIGIVDGTNFFLQPETPADVPSEAQPIIFMGNIVIILRSGDSPGKHKLRLIMEQPDGKRKKAMEKEIELSDRPNGGINIKTGITLQIQLAGLYWIDVILDNKRITRMPFNITIQRLPSTSMSKAKAITKK
jgi:hypothetical protein